ncbi:basic helix-loop-helix (bHLH) DNA-bindingsuperfamily protein [Striga asiatica]|uniref:Basic helix-loop-helix (BHLH) DNA-bindingsuperfamily protein n=1 Tax=Striga asiatica TaxID=4170 RepID=A0A5A7QDE8_STRAF|nr:basic helix-loop-helix (bHLH) DNA-bindingsuperfamily protein [Striga asiatica]
MASITNHKILETSHRARENAKYDTHRSHGIDCSQLVKTDPIALQRIFLVIGAERIKIDVGKGGRGPRRSFDPADQGRRQQELEELPAIASVPAQQGARRLHHKNSIFCAEKKDELSSSFPRSEVGTMENEKWSCAIFLRGPERLLFEEREKSRRHED